MAQGYLTDYETYREILDDLLQPINAANLDTNTIKRLYQSKITYLENLRLRCFSDINKASITPFTQHDYSIILHAKQVAQVHLRQLILATLHTSLEKL